MPFDQQWIKSSETCKYVQKRHNSSSHVGWFIHHGSSTYLFFLRLRAAGSSSSLYSRGILGNSSQEEVKLTGQTVIMETCSVGLHRLLYPLDTAGRSYRVFERELSIAKRQGFLFKLAKLLTVKINCINMCAHFSTSKTLSSRMLRLQCCMSICNMLNTKW